MPDSENRTAMDAVARTKADPNRSFREDALVEEVERLRRLLWMIQDQSYHPSGYLKDMIEAAVKYD